VFSRAECEYFDVILVDINALVSFLCVSGT
jgi:hypothetical protein